MVAKDYKVCHILIDTFQLSEIILKNFTTIRKKNSINNQIVYFKKTSIMKNFRIQQRSCPAISAAKILSNQKGSTGAELFC